MFQLVGVCIVVICLQLTSASIEDDGKIQYPGPVKRRLEVPAECRHQNYCTVKPKHYPQEEFDKMIHGKVGDPPKPILPEIDNFPNRQSGPDDKDDCAYNVSYDPMYMVQSKEGDWWNVINSAKMNYVQKIRLETCLKPGTSCFGVYGEIPGITTYCRQDTNEWEFVVSDNAGGMKNITTKLPVCCSCHFHYKP